MIDARELLTAYITNGGKDLGEFLLGTEGRKTISPSADATHLIGNFQGVQQKSGLTYAKLCSELEMKNSSFKRMLGNNRIDSGDVVSRCAANLGIKEGTPEDAMFWFLARGDKTLPTVEEIVTTAKQALHEKEANPQKIAREAALKLFSRSGYTHEKYGALTAREGMIKEMTRNEGYSFSGERAELFAGAIVPKQTYMINTLSNMLIGIDRKKQIPTLIKELEDGEITFGNLLEQVRKQRHEKQSEFAASFTKFLAKEKCIDPSPVISQSMMEKWENDKVLPQGNAIADALAKFLGFDPDHYSLIPRDAHQAMPLEERVKPEVWMERIRTGELTFAEYIKTLLKEEELTFASFGKSIPHNENGIHESYISGWTKGKRANAAHAEALANRAGFLEEPNRKDFLAFARTGRLRRNDPDDLLNKLLSGEMQLAEFVQQLRSESGMSPEEMDEAFGLGKGTVRNMEAGRELRSNAAQQFADHMPYLGERKKAFQQRLIKKGELGPSASGIDPQGYETLIDAAMVHAHEQNLKTLRSATSGIRFNHHDPMVERWWRAMAAEQSANDIERQGHVSTAAVEGWNDLHDLLFAEVNPARLNSKKFKTHIEAIAEFLSSRDDGNTAIKTMTATIIRAIEGKTPEQRTKLAQTAGQLNMKMLQSAVTFESSKMPSWLDKAVAWDKSYDLTVKALEEGKMAIFANMTAYMRMIVRNAVIDIVRRQASRHENTFTDPEILGNLATTPAVVEDITAITASDVLAALKKLKKTLSKTDRDILDSMLQSDPSEKGLYERIATELEISVGTVKSRVSHLRATLIEVPGLMELLGNAMGTSYAETVQARRKKSGTGGGHGRAGSDED